MLLYLRPEFVLPGSLQLQVKRLVTLGVHPDYWYDPAAAPVGDLEPFVIVEMLNPLRRIWIEAQAVRYPALLGSS